MSANSDETIPQIALFIQESSVRPAPPPPQAPSTSVPWSSARAPRNMILPMQRLPPPPPPPPAVPSTSNPQHNPVYHDSYPQPSTSYAISHPPPAVPMFDPSRPPPPLHNQVQQKNNYKRSISHNCAAGPSKLRKTEEPKPDDALCDECVQRENSIKGYRIKMDKISSEDECQTLLYKKKLKEYHKQKDVLRSLVDVFMYKKVEDFLEDVPQYDFRSALNSLKDSILTKLASSIPNQMQMHFMEFLLSHSSKFESTSSVSVEDSLRQTLSSMSRSPVRRPSPDFLQTLQDILYNEERFSSPDRPGHSGLSTERAQSSGASGVLSYRQYTNGQRAQPLALLPPPSSVPAPPPHAPVAPPAAPPVAPPAAPPVAPPAPPLVAPPVPPPSVNYPHYPPPRPYYPPYPNQPGPSRAPTPSSPPYGERYQSPYYYYK